MADKVNEKTRNTTVVFYFRNGKDISGTNTNSEDSQDGQESDISECFDRTFSVFECFKILGIDPDTNLNQAKLNIVFMKSIQKAHPDKAPLDEVSQRMANEICWTINHARNILQEMFENSSVYMCAKKSEEENDWDAENSEEENKWGSGGDYGDGWGPGFGEDDGCDSDESESHVTESMILEVFEILGLDLKTELTRKTW